MNHQMMGMVERGDQKKKQPVVLLIGDILEFEWESNLYSGIVEEISEPYVQIQHLDSKHKGKSFQYLIACFNDPPNWIAIKEPLRSERIMRFSELRERMCISFQATDDDEKGNPIVRTRVVMELYKEKKLKLKLLTGPPKPKISGDEDDEKYLQQISDADDVWDWTVFYNIQEIIIPPPDNIATGDIQ